MHECFECGRRAVVWDNDFDYEDYCLDGNGIVHILHCMHCGAKIMYFCQDNDGNDEEGE